MPREYDLTLPRGETFVLGVRWEAGPWLYSAITSVSNGAPAVITTTGHTIPDGWEVAVVDAKGLTQLNAKNNPPKRSDMRRATVLSATMVELNDVSSASFGRHTASTGYLAWMTPKSLVGYSARMQIRDRSGGAVLLSLTSGAGDGIALDDNLKLIEVTITAAQTEAMNWTSGVYDLELVSSGGVVTKLLKGTVTPEAEVTAPIT